MYGLLFSSVLIVQYFLQNPLASPLAMQPDLCSPVKSFPMTSLKSYKSVGYAKYCLTFYHTSVWIKPTHADGFVIGPRSNKVPEGAPC